MDAAVRLERKVLIGRRRRLCRIHQLWRYRRCTPAGICRRLNRHGARRRHGRFRAGPSGKGGRLRVASKTSASRSLQGHHHRFLRGSDPALVFQLVLERGASGSDGSPAFSGRLRWRARGCAGQRLDASLRRLRMERAGALRDDGCVRKREQARRGPGGHARNMRRTRRSRRRGRGGSKEMLVRSRHVGLSRRH